MSSADHFVAEHIDRMFFGIAVDIHLEAMTKREAIAALSVYGLDRDYIAWEDNASRN